MEHDNFDPEDFNSTAYIDILMNTILGLIAIIAAVILFVQMENKIKDASSDPPGNMIVHIVWPNGDTDIDLWVDGPGELNPIGYSNKGGILWNLLRDDLGSMPDATDINYEDAFTRGVVGGEYVINVMCYRCPILPQEVSVKVDINTGEPGKSSLKPLVETKVKLVTEGQERTAIRFKIDNKGNLLKDSVNSVFKPLRSAKPNNIPGVH